MNRMIDILYNKLGACNDVSLAEWKDIDAMLFNKHSQATQATQASLNTKVILDIVEEKSSAVLKSSAFPEDSKLRTSFSATAIAATAATAAKKKPAKDTTVKPLNIIMNETTSFHNSTEHIKDALITLISKEEFSKIFGLTKCAEIMSGVVNNRWNKSTALFISFLLDKEVYYNDKVIIYNKEKNIGRLIIP